MKKNNPNSLYQIALSHIVYKAVALATTMKLDDRLRTKPISIAKLAKSYGYHPCAMFRFLRLLDAYDVVKVIGTTHVKQGALLCYLKNMRSLHLLQSYAYIDNFEHCLKTNKESFSKTFGKPMYPYLLDHPDVLAEFKAWCTRSAQDWLPEVFKIYNFAPFSHIVDVGGGEGYFLAALLQKHKKIRGTLFDQPAVVTEAEELFKRKNVAKRVKIVGGDFFKKLPCDGDAYIFCRVLLNWDDEDAKILLNNCHKHMQPGATLLIIDFVVPPKSHPTYKMVAASDLNMLACANSAFRTKAEWLELIRKTKFKVKHFHVNYDISPKLISPLFVLEAKV